MEYVIRQVRENEIVSLVDMCERHAEYEKAVYKREGKEQALQKILFDKNQKLFCYVIEANEEIAGYFSYTFDTSTWDASVFLYLDCLYFEPNYRGLRIGDKVFDKLIEIARENNCINIQWQTPAFNEKAIRFYNRIGATGKRKSGFSWTCKLENLLIESK